MKNKLFVLSLLLIMAGLFTACNTGVGPESSTTSASPATSTAATTSATAATQATTATAGAYRQISAEDARDWLAKDEGVLLLDVRTEDEYKEIRIPGSQLLPYDEIIARKGELPADLDTPIIVYCRSGRRSAIAAETLLGLGYTEVYDLGGIQDWPYETEKG